MSPCPGCEPSNPAAREAARCELHDHNLRVEVPRGALRLILSRYLAGDTSVDRDTDLACAALADALLTVTDHYGEGYAQGAPCDCQPAGNGDYPAGGERP